MRTHGSLGCEAELAAAINVLHQLRVQDDEVRAQNAALLEALRALYSAGQHTAVESTIFCPRCEAEQAARYAIAEAEGKTKWPYACAPRTPRC